MKAPRLHQTLLFFALTLGGLSAALSGLASAAEKPLQVFILAGQSNMQGHAHIDTFASMAHDPKTAPLLEKMTNEDGTPAICERVWISSIGSSEEEKVGKLTAGFGADARGPKIGPEFTFGLMMQDLLPDHDILIIKTAWGGKSINTDFRPPNAPPYEFSEQQLERFESQGKDLEQIQAEKKEASGHYYRLMLDHTKAVLADLERVYPDYNESAGYEMAGFVWFQGWNDMVDSGTYPQRGQPGGYDQYSELMAQFIRDIRQDLSSPELPFVIGVLGVNGPTKLYGPDQKRYLGIHQGFRDAMAAPTRLPEFEGNVAAVLTENYWDLEVSSLRKKEREIKATEKEMQKEGKQSREEIRAAIDQLYADTFSEDELDLLRNSVSNAEFHYLGSARILGPIGAGFADAMGEMMGIGSR